MFIICIGLSGKNVFCMGTVVEVGLLVRVIVVLLSMVVSTLVVVYWDCFMVSFVGFVDVVVG